MSQIKLGGAAGSSQDTKDAQAIVALDPSLKAGTYTFGLIVIDDLGNQSAQAKIQVVVHDGPTAVFNVPKSTTTAITGKPITLDGSLSTPAANITTYRWQLVTGAPVG